MTACSRRLLVFLLVCGGVAVVGCSCLSVRDAARRAETLTPTVPPARLVVWKASAGTNHVLNLGFWPALNPLRARFPRLKPLLGEPAEQVRWEGLPPCLTVFLGAQDPTSGAAVDGVLEQLDSVRPVDTHGCVMEAAYGAFPYPTGRGLVGLVDLRSYPRRQKTFDADFVFSGNPPYAVGARSEPVDSATVTTVPEAGHPRIRMAIGNPEPWTGKEWIPDALPAHRESDGLRVECLGWGGTLESPQPRVRILEAGVVTTAWEFRQNAFLDVTGNVCPEPRLCRFEPAWRWHILLIRKPEAVTEAQGAWVLSPVSRPGPLEAVPVGQVREALGMEVRVVAHGGPGVFQFRHREDWRWVGSRGLPTPLRPDLPRIESGRDSGEDWVEYRSARSWMAVQYLKYSPDVTSSIAAVDPGGNHHAQWPGMTHDGGLFFHEFDIPPEVTEVGWKVVIQPTHRFEFTLPPPPVPTAL